MKQKDFYNLYDQLNKDSNMTISPGNKLSDIEICNLLTKKYFPIFEKYIELDDLFQEIYTELIYENRKNGRLRTYRLPQTLNHIYNKYEEQYDYEEIYDTSYYIDNLVYLKNISNLMDEILDTLNFRERLVIELRYGFKDGKQYSLAEIGEIVGNKLYGGGLTIGRIRQIEIKTFKKLRHRSRANPLRDLKEAIETEYGEL